MSEYIGELAALGTSLAFAFGSTFFSLAGIRLSAIVVNRTRLVIAVILLSITHWIVLGSLWPLDAAPERWLWLGLSGIIGLVVGDIFLFQAFVIIGPRLSMLLMSLAPVIATIQAWIFLAEKLNINQLIGILLALCGVIWVVLEKGLNWQEKPPGYRRGIIYGLIGALGQGTGLVLAKVGLAGDFSPVSANVIRMLTAVVLMWIITLLQGQVRVTLQILSKNRLGTILTLAGSICGPYLGVSLSLLAVQQIEVGIASTLTSLPPIFLLPISYFALKERFGWGAILGTFIALLGVAVLFLF